MFKRLTTREGDPLYLNAAHIVAAKPRYNGDEFTHTQLFTTGGIFDVQELVDEIDAAEVGNYTPRSPLP